MLIEVYSRRTNVAWNMASDQIFNKINNNAQLFSSFRKNNEFFQNKFESLVWNVNEWMNNEKDFNKIDWLILRKKERKERKKKVWNYRAKQSSGIRQFFIFLFISCCSFLVDLSRYFTEQSRAQHTRIHTCNMPRFIWILEWIKKKVRRINCFFFLSSLVPLLLFDHHFFFLIKKRIENNKSNECWCTANFSVHVHNRI